MNRRILSIILTVLMCLALFSLPAAAEINASVAAVYAGGVVSVSGTGFTGGAVYTVRVVDVANSSIKAMGQATADGSGNITASITTGVLGTPANYTVYVNKQDGTLAGSADSIGGESLSDAQKVAADRGALVAGLIKGTNSGLDNVTADLNLITGISGGAGCVISWASGNTAVIAANGTVTRPAAGDGDATVTLTATITSGAVSDTKQFTATVKQATALYTATIRAGSGGAITAGTSGGYAPGAVISLEASANSRYTFSRWTSSGGGTFANANSASTTFTMPTANVTITANFTSSGGNGGGATPAPSPTPTPEPSTTGEDNTPGVSAVVKAATDPTTGTATALIDANTVKDLVDHAKEAEASGQEAVVKIKVEPEAGAKAVDVEIPGYAFSQLAGATTAGLEVDTGIAALTFEAEAVVSLGDSSQTEDVNISVKKVDKADLSADIQAKVGDRPVYDFSVKVGDTVISEFGGGKVEVGIPYTPEPGEKEDAIVVYYINASGSLETVMGRYDAATGTVKFTTTHFSRYVVGYNEVKFIDVAVNAWYNKAVGFIAARGIAGGVGNGRFAPESRVTRADFLIMVMNSYGIKPDAAITDNFADAGGKYYAGYLGTAKRLGLATGVGNNKYAPEASISRQDMFLILYRILDKLGELPAGTNGKSLGSFKDANGISGYAKDAMKLFVETGIISGYGGNLTPKAASTRAEAAQVLYGLLSE